MVLVFRHHRVGAGRIDDIEIAQKIDRLITFGQARGDFDGAFFAAVFENVNAIRRRQDVDFGKLLAEERIEERRFSRFHFAYDNEKKRFANVGDQTLNRVERLRITLQLRFELE